VLVTKNERFCSKNHLAVIRDFISEGSIRKKDVALCGQVRLHKPFRRNEEKTVGEIVNAL